MAHAIDDDAARFYAAFGFKSFAGDARTTFLPMETIKRAILGA